MSVRQNMSFALRLTRARQRAAIVYTGRALARNTLQSQLVPA